jgi:4a-hydroxytetrahydrobiopterin dehydratase
MSDLPRNLSGIRLCSEYGQPMGTGAASLLSHEVDRLLQTLPEWQSSSAKGEITRTYQCSSYMDGVKWFALAAALAQQEDQCPDALVTGCSVTLTLRSRDAAGVSRNDFIMAAKLESAWTAFLGGTQQKRSDT